MHSHRSEEMCSVQRREKDALESADNGAGGAASAAKVLAVRERQTERDLRAQAGQGNAIESSRQLI